MFRKRLKLKPVKRYPMPGYPVVDEAGKAVYVPSEWTLGRLARPAAPLALAAFLSQPAPAAADIAGPGPVPAMIRPLHDGTHRGIGAPQDPAGRRPIRRLSERETKALIADLKIQPEPRAAMGKVAARPEAAGLTEEQGRRILERFFMKNGFVFAGHPEVDGTPVDRFDPGRKIGFEFLDASEVATKGKLEKVAEILVVKADEIRRLPTAAEVVTRLQDAAEKFMRARESEGKLWARTALDGILKRLDADGAEKELAALGIESLVDLRQEARAATGARRDRIEAAIQAIMTTKVDPLIERLEADDPDAREEATTQLIEAGEPVKARVQEALKFAEGASRPEQAARCRNILECIGD